MNTETRFALRRDFEIFLCWFAGAHIISSLLTALGIPYSISHMVREGGSLNSTGLVWLTTLSAHLTGVVTAIWLWRREYTDNRSRIIWTIFGLASALWAIGLYLLIIVVTDYKSDSDESEPNELEI